MICRKIKALEVIGTTHGLQSMMAYPPYDNNEGDRLYSPTRFRECVRRFANLESVELGVNARKQPEMIEWDLMSILLGQMTCLLYDILVCPISKLRSLRSEGLEWLSPCYFPGILSENPANLQKTRHNAGGLLQLDVTIQPIEERFTALQTDRLLHFLMWAPNLEHLTLDFGNSTEYNVSLACSFNRICSLRFHRLRSIALSCGELSQGGFLDFLIAHRTTLKEVRLGSVYLTEGWWYSLLNIISGARLPLERILLEGRLLDPWLDRNNLFLCGDHLTPVVMDRLVRPGRMIYYPSNIPRSRQVALQLEHEVRKQRKIAGLPCISCETCGRLIHAQMRI